MADLSLSFLEAIFCRSFENSPKKLVWQVYVSPLTGWLDHLCALLLQSVLCGDLGRAAVLASGRGSPGPDGLLSLSCKGSRLSLSSLEADSKNQMAPTHNNQLYPQRWLEVKWTMTWHHVPILWATANPLWRPHVQELQQPQRSMGNPAQHKEVNLSHLPCFLPGEAIHWARCFSQLLARSWMI